MSKGKRYEATQPKLNMKKVFAVIIALIVIIMFIYIITGAFSSKDKTSNKLTVKNYFASYKDNKWGVIDSNGDTVIDPSYQEMIIVPDEKIDVFLCTYDVNYETGEYKTKALNSKNEEIYTQYDNIEAIQNKDNNSLWYEENVLKIQKDGKYGTIDLTGKQLLNTEYEEITPILGIKNALKIRKDGKYGIAGNDGKIVIEPKYVDITNLGEDNKSGYIVRDESGKYGIVDYSAKTVLECKYDEIYKVYGNDKYVVKESNTEKLVNKDGETLISSGFDEITSILKSQDAGVIFKLKNKYGVMSLTGEIVLKPEYDDLKEAKTDILISKKDNKYSIIDMQGNKKINQDYIDISYQETADMYIAEKENFETDILNGNYEVKLSGILLDFNVDKTYIKMKIDDQNKYYNFNFEEKKESDIFTNNTLFINKQDGKYGFVDKDGKEVVKCEYDDVTEQNSYGFAGIKKDGRWGVIDSTGKVIQEPVYDLENYLIVDFIGRWHLGEDIYMNYYNQI